MTSTIVSSTKVPFTILTVVSLILLEGFLITNGAFFGILAPAWSGKSADGKPFYRVYTGLPIIDEILIMPVAYWRGVTGTTPILHLQAAMLCASLQAFPVWAGIEQMRKGNKHAILRLSFIYAFCWQYVGVAILMPYYFYVELSHHFNPKKPSDPRASPLKAKTLLPCAIIVGLGLYRMLFFPPAEVSESQHFLFNAYFHLSSLLTFGLTCAVCAAMESNSNKGARETDKHSDLPWIKRTYAFFGAFAGIVHLIILLYAWMSTDSSISPEQLLVPRFSKIWRADRAERLYVEETLFFDQWDFILIVLQCALYTSRILEVMYCKENKEWSSVKRSGVVIVVGIACTILSPGLVVSGALYVREDFLRQRFEAAQRQNMLQVTADKVEE